MAFKTIEAYIDKRGQVHLDEPVVLSGPRKVLVTIIDEESTPETALLSQETLAKDWLIEEEDAAWNHLQKDR